MALKEVTANLGFQPITMLTTSTALTLPSGAATGYLPRMAAIQADTQNIRWRDDGTDPTASVGMRLLVGETLYYDGELTKLRLIEEVVGAKANISYYS